MNPKRTKTVLQIIEGLHRRGLLDLASEVAREHLLTLEDLLTGGRSFAYARLDLYVRMAGQGLSAGEIGEILDRDNRGVSRLLKVDEIRKLRRARQQGAA